jgi:hypothetical protein
VNASPSFSLIPYGILSLYLRVSNSGDVFQRLLRRLNREVAVSVDCYFDTVGASGLSSLPANDVRSLSQRFAEWESCQCYNLYLERNIEDVAVSPGCRKNIPGPHKKNISIRKMAELIVIIKCYIILHTYISIQRSTLYDP